MTAHTALAATDLAAARARNEEIWHASSEAFHSGRIDEFMQYWCADARYEAALPVGGLPPVVAGREALHATFSALVASAVSIAVHDVRFHQTDDPQVAIIEERMVAELRGGGTYENRLIIRTTFRDGKIAEMFEYYGQLAHQDMLRQLGFAD
jgi:ketosteroid isomerase-like protein